MVTTSRRPPRSAARGVALVTGGAKRMGRSIALALADDGWDVAIHFSASARDAARTVDDIHARGRKAVALAADLADEAATRNLIAQTTEALGRPRCLVNNASLFQADEATTVDYAGIARHMQVNLAAPLVLTQELHRATPASANAVVINVLDQKLFNPNPDYVSYTLSKAALHAATTLLAQACAPRLRVVGVAPGLSLPSADQTRAEFARAHAKTPLGRSSTPDDVADAIRYLASARAVTGSVLLVDGGQHLVPTERDIMFVTRD